MSDNVENIENPAPKKAPKQPKAPKEPRQPWQPPTEVQDTVDVMFKYAATGDKKIMAFFARKAIEARDEGKRIRNLAAVEEVIDGVTSSDDA